MTDDRRHINWDMIVRHLMDVATDEEREEVERWLAEDEGNREYYRKAKRYFETYYTGEETRVVDSKGAWDEFVVYADKSRNAWDLVTGFWEMIPPKRPSSRGAYPLSRERQRPCWSLIPVNG